MFKKILLAAVGVIALCATANAQQGLWPGLPLAGSTTPNTDCASKVNGACQYFLPPGAPITGNELAPVDTGLSQGQNPQTERMRITQFGGASSPRNLLGNGDLLGTQVNGTGTVTGATTSAPTSAALIADRWVLVTNVGSGAGRSAIVTSSPTAPSGFTQVAKVFRTSGALTQPICAWQAVPSPQSLLAAGSTVSFSVQVAALAGLAADNGNTANLVIIAGTGTDEGLAVAPSTTPLITPAWTGISTLVNTPISLTTAFARYFTTAAVPSTATELGVGICFTPTTSGSGATDGFAFVGAQLERSALPSTYEIRPRQAELLDNLQFVYSVHEGATLLSRWQGHFTTSGTALSFPVVFPVPMYKAPTMAYTTGFAGFTTTAETTANACTGLGTDTTITFIPSTTQVMATCTIASGTTAAVGISMTVADASGASGIITAWSGF
jgi:hypothetical protein